MAACLNTSTPNNCDKLYAELSLLSEWLEKKKRKDKFATELESIRPINYTKTICSLLTKYLAIYVICDTMLEFMFTGINILNQSHFRLICFVRVKMTQRKVHNIFIPTNINCTTIIIILDSIEKLKTKETQSEQLSKYLSKLKPIVPTKCATMHGKVTLICVMCLIPTMVYTIDSGVYISYTQCPFFSLSFGN